MPSRNELNLRARVLGLDSSTIYNDSKLEQKILWLEKNATTFAGTDGSQTLTTTGVFSDGDTITIGDRVYTMKTTLGTTAGQVLIGAAATNSLDNLKSAINATGTAGTDYTANTPIHQTVSAGTKTSSTLVVNPRDKAYTNADIATTETGANCSWGGTTIASGVAAVVAVAASGTRDTLAGVAGDKNLI
jgi:hypothetical protein